MAARIIPKKTTVSGRTPSSANLDPGELAVNLTDGIIFTKHTDGSIVNLTGALDLHTHSISQVTGLQSALDGKVDSVNGYSGVVTLNTDDVSEGTTNRYHTTARVRSSVSATGDLSYNETTGVFSFNETYSTPLQIKNAYESNTDTNAYTDSEKSKLAGIESGAQVNVATNLGQSRTTTSYTITSSTGTNTSLASATTTNAGVMTAADKTKLNGIEAGAEVNTVDTVNGKTGAVVLDTGDVDEGSNLYYTPERVKSEISVSGDLTYNSTTGVISFSETYSTPLELRAALVTVDGVGSGINSDLLDGQHGAFYQNASNLNAGTIPDARLPDTISSDITGTADNANKLDNLDSTQFLRSDQNDTATGLITFQEGVRTDKYVNSTGRVLTYDFSVSGNNSIGDLDSYYDAGEVVELFSFIPTGSSHNYYVEGTVKIQSSANVETLFIRAGIRSNTVPDMWCLAHYQRFSEANYSAAYPEFWLNEVDGNGEARLVLVITGNNVQDIECSFKVFQRAAYGEALSVLANHVDDVLPPNFTRRSIALRTELGNFGLKVNGGEVWHSENDGANSGLDADLLDGKHASAFATSAQGGLADSAVQPGDLASVATSGDYNDLSNKPDLSALEEVNVYPSQSGFPTTGESGKVYIAENTGYMYRWNGAGYTQLTDQTAIWGQISGTLTDQTDLKNALNGKANSSHSHTSGDLPTTIMYEGENISLLNNNSGYITSAQAPVQSVNGSSGTVVLDTGDISENGNLYFTNARARSAIGVSGDLSYNSTTGVITFNETYSTPSEVKTAYESNTNTNAYTDAEKTKLANIEAGAQVNVATNLGQSRTTTSYTITSSTGNNTTLAAATTSAAGVMTAADKTKLNGIEAGAEANTVDSVDGQTGAVTLNYDNYGGWALQTDGVSRGTITSGETVNLVGGSNVSLSYSATNNAVTINSTNTNTTYSAGTGITLSGTTFSLTDERYTLTEKNKLSNIEAGAEVNVGTNLAMGGSGDSRSITSSTGSNVSVPVATTTNAGFMAIGDKTKLNGIEAGAQVNVATNLGQSRNATSYTITSSTGSNTSLAAATTANAGVLTAADKTKLNNLDNVNLTAGTNVSISGTYPNLTISSTNTNTTYSAGNGISLSGTTFSVAGGDGLTQQASGLAVDSTVVRTSGTQSISGIKTFNDDVVMNDSATSYQSGSEGCRVEYNAASKSLEYNFF